MWGVGLYHKVHVSIHPLWADFTPKWGKGEGRRWEGVRREGVVVRILLGAGYYNLCKSPLTHQSELAGCLQKRRSIHNVKSWVHAGWCATWSQTAKPNVMKIFFLIKGRMGVHKVSYPIHKFEQKVVGERGGRGGGGEGVEHLPDTG